MNSGRDGNVNICLIFDKVKIVNEWKLARVVETHTSSDGIVVKVKLEN